MKKFLTWALVLSLVFAMVGCGDSGTSEKTEKSDDVIEFEELVDEIGKVTLDSEEAIKKAEEACEKLSKKEKKQTDKDDELEEIRETFNRLVDEAKIKDVEAKIDAIGDVTLESSAKIDEAQKAYDELSDKNKEKVKNADKLTNAVEALETVKKEQAEALLGGMRVEEDRVRGINFYYPSTMNFYSDGWAADISCFVMPYIGKDDSSSWLRLIYNYTADDWIFFKKITIMADGEKYYKTFNYYDITRDNESGDIWEYIDVEPSDADIDMLWAIANSEETIVRFEGDEYYDDYTVTASNKQGIKEALMAYEALN